VFCRVAPFAHTSHARTDVPHPRALTQRSATSGTTASHPASWEDPRSPVLICHRLHGRAVGARACTLRRDEPPTFLSEATPLTLSDCLDQTSRGHRKLPHQSTYSIECAHLGVGLKRLPPCASAVAAPLALDQDQVTRASTCARTSARPTINVLKMVRHADALAHLLSLVLRSRRLPSLLGVPRSTPGVAGAAS